MTGANEAKSRLANAQWLRSTDLQAAFDLLDGTARRTRVVGGIVRNTLLGRLDDGTDIDLATELTPDEVMARARSAHIRCVPSGLEFGTVTLVYPSQTFEITTLRQDLATDGRRAVVRFGSDWKMDASRRDFTFNALYAEIDGTLFDPLGGLDDCLHGRIRFIGDPDKRIVEDRLRVYRFFRFSASHGAQSLDSEGLKACARAADKLGNLSAERVGAEIKKMLALPEVAATLATMAQSSILPLPRRAIQLLRAYETLGLPTISGRLALIRHAAPELDLATIWRLSNADLDTARELLATADLIGTGALNEAMFRYSEVCAGAVVVAAAMNAHSADWVLANQKEAALIHPKPLPVTGKDLLAAGIPHGPAIGKRLAALEKAWIGSNFSMDREALMALAKKPRQTAPKG